MYEMPNIYETHNYLIEIPDPMMSIIEEECTFIARCCDNDVYNLCEHIVLEKQLIKNKHLYVAYQLYIQLRREISALI